MDCLGKCPGCGKFSEVTLRRREPPPPCPACGAELFPQLADATRDAEELPQCPYCGGKHVYRQKDFNKKLGVGLLALGIAGAYFTYGISLVAVTLIDWALYRRVGDVGCCYLCQAQFRDFAALGKLPPFDLILHDHYRARRGD